MKRDKRNQTASYRENPYRRFLRRWSRLERQLPCSSLHKARLDSQSEDQKHPTPSSKDALHPQRLRASVPCFAIFSFYAETEACLQKLLFLLDALKTRAYTGAHPSVSKVHKALQLLQESRNLLTREEDQQSSLCKGRDPYKEFTKEEVRRQ